MTPDKNVRVLVVDDDLAALALIARTVESAGHEVLTACNGMEGMRVALEQGPPLIITDWTMPEMDGVEFCRAIRSHEGISFAFVILLTAHSDEDRLVEAFDAGADDYLSKPFNRRELLARLHAGIRIIQLQEDLNRRRREMHRANAELAITHTDLARANERLNLMATTDELTGLTNRREAMVRLDEAWAVSGRRDESLSCIMLDIDHFKKFNDAYGHAIGDLVLKEIAHTLKACSRSDERVCRVGGEEFLVVLSPGSTEAMAGVAAERMRKAIEVRRVESDGMELKVTISLGVAERTPETADPDDLLSVADAALYAAKKAGRNRVACASEDNGEGDDETAIQDDSASPIAPAPRAHGATAGKVLVVDDDVSMRALCARLLAREGYQVEEAIDGLDALVKVHHFHPDVIIMDSMMPNMNGVDCTRRLRDDPATCDIPIIMASARARQEDIVSALEAGVDEYVTKPIRPKEFALRVRSMVRFHRSMQELVQSNEVRGEQTRVMALLLDYSHRLTIAENLDKVFEETIKVTGELTCCRRISIMLPDDEGRFLKIAQSSGISEDIVSQVRVPIGGAIAGKVFESRTPIVINESEEPSSHGPRYDSDFFVSAPLLSHALSTSEHVVGVLNITERQGGHPFEPRDLEHVDLIANVAASTIHAFLTRQARDEARDSIVVALAKLTECRDDDTGRHLERVTRFCVLLARELRTTRRYRDTIDDAFLRDLKRAVPLHDIGKVAVPDHILNKPGRLTDEELVIMRTHTTVGARVIHPVVERAPGVQFLRMAEQIIHGHHEWFNGEGYPRRKSGEEIPLPARIAAVADVYDALTTERVYKDAISHTRSAEIITGASGSQFDPDVVDAFTRCLSAFEQLAADLADGVDEDTDTACDGATAEPATAPTACS